MSKSDEPWGPKDEEYWNNAIQQSELAVPQHVRRRRMGWRMWAFKFVLAFTVTYLGYLLIKNGVDWL